MKTQPRAGSSATLGALFAIGAALSFSTAGVIVRRNRHACVGRLVLAIDPAGCHNFASARFCIVVAC